MKISLAGVDEMINDLIVENTRLLVEHLKCVKNKEKVALLIDRIVYLRVSRILMGVLEVAMKYAFEEDKIESEG